MLWLSKCKLSKRACIAPIFLSNVNINTDESAMMIKGFNICDGTIVAIYAPHADAEKYKTK